MGYLGIDIGRARDLAGLFVELGGRVAQIQSLITQAETLGEIPTGASVHLDEIDRTYVGLARAIDTAANRAEAFRFPAWWRSEANVSSYSTPPRWDAASRTAWNDVHQQANHNSYDVDGGISELYQHGLRAFELDIHRGAPTDFLRAAQWPTGPFLTYLDHRSNGGGAADDWLVYHHSADTESEYRFLSHGLRAVAALQSSDPITVFVDNKDGFGGTHTPARLNELLAEELGATLFTPQDLLERAPGADSLRQAINVAGWPTTRELEGRVIVVLTEDVDGYRIEGASAFVSVEPNVWPGPVG